MTMNRIASIPNEAGQSDIHLTMLDGIPVVMHWSPSRASGAIGVVRFFALWCLIAFAVGLLYSLALGPGELILASTAVSLALS